MPTEQIMNSLVINKVDKTETLNAMKKMEDFDASQVYVVEDPLGRIPVTTEEVEDYDAWIEPGTGASVLKYRDPSSGEIKKVGGGSTVHISDEPPVSPEESNVWIDTSEEGEEDSYYTKEQTEELVNNRIDAKFEELDPADIGAATEEFATNAATNAAAQVKNDLLMGAGEAYDTLKELGELIDDNVDAIEALEIVAASKANSSDLTAHIGNKSNPHSVTATQVGALELVNAAGMNLDTILTSGSHYKLYRISDTTEKTPFTEGVSARKYGLVLSYASSASYGHQFAMLAGAECLFHRTNVNGTISQWSQIYSQNWKPTAADVGAYDLSLGELIPNNADLDTYTELGSYYSPNATVTASLNNAPALGAGFKLIVEQGYGASHRIQKAIFNTTGRILWRYAVGSSWTTGWIEAATTATALMCNGSNSMTGNLAIEKNTPIFRLRDTATGAEGTIFNANDRVYFQVMNDAASDKNRRQVQLLDSDVSTLAKSLVLVDVVDGVATGYDIYHKGNKPTAADVGARKASGGKNSIGVDANTLLTEGSYICSASSNGGTASQNAAINLPAEAGFFSINVYATLNNIANGCVQVAYARDTGSVNVRCFLNNNWGTWKNLATTNRTLDLTEKSATLIPENADLNSVEFLKVGNYKTVNDSQTATIQNRPTSNTFHMVVMAFDDRVGIETTANYIYRVRIATTYRGQVYIQHVSNGTNINQFTFSSWVRLYRTDDTFDASKITSGTLPVERGGTGATSLKTAANSLINSLETGNSTPTDADYYVSQFVGGGTTTTTYYRRPMSALWAYIKSKADSVYASSLSSLGVTATATELNYVDGVTSNIQTQLNSKASTAAATTSANGLMTSAMVTKLNGIATGATKVTVDTALSSTSTNPVQNKVVNSALAAKATTATYNATITTSWTASGDYYYQNITVSGITANDNPIVDVKTGTDNAANKLYSEGIGKVIRIATAANQITVYATEAISTAFPIQLKVVR